jgi:hypothetical protein
VLPQVAKNLRTGPKGVVAIELSLKVCAALRWSHLIASVYIESSMRTSVFKFAAIVVLSLHVMPLGLPLFCDTDRHCDGQMPMPMTSGSSIDQASNATDCVGSIFCAVMGTAALVLSTSLSVFLSDSYVVAFDVSTFAPFDPQPPLPPPPQA